LIFCTYCKGPIQKHTLQDIVTAFSKTIDINTFYDQRGII